MDPARLDVAILSAARTPVAKARRGAFKDLTAFDLAEVAVAAALERSGVPGELLEDIVLAESLQGGGDIARHTAVRLGLPNLPGLAVNRHCAGGLAAVQTAAAQLSLGMGNAMLAGGTESLTSMPAVLRGGNPWMSPSHPATPDAPSHDMSITVGENTARELGLTRADVDGWAALTHQRAAACRERGDFVEEIVPVTLPDGTVAELDEQPRAGTTVETLAALAVLHPELDDATVTAGNSSGLNDAAACVLLGSSDFAAAQGLSPLAWIRSWSVAALEPSRTGLTPTVAIPKALERAGLTISDVDLFEINEAFCSVPLAAVQKLGIDPDRLNVNGSGCSLGHPIAATGTRMIVTMIHELKRRGGGTGVVAMCAGGGMGSALVLDVAD